MKNWAICRRALVSEFTQLNERSQRADKSPRDCSTLPVGVSMTMKLAQLKLKEEE